MEADDPLCSRNAWPRKDGEGSSRPIAGLGIGMQFCWTFRNDSDVEL